MDGVFGINYFYIKVLSFKKINGFFKVRISPEGNLGFSVEGIKFGEIEMF